MAWVLVFCLCLFLGGGFGLVSGEGGWGGWFLFALQRWMRREGRVCVVILNVGVILSSLVFSFFVQREV